MSEGTVLEHTATRTSADVNTAFWHRDAVFIAGFRKCGTTSVFDYLAGFNSCFSACNVKEPQFFPAANRHDPTAVRWYQSLFDDADSAILDGSLLMMSDPTCFDAVARLFKGSVTVLAVVRDPAARTISAYQHMRKKGLGIESRRFSSVLQAIEEAPGNTLWDKESYALEQADQAGKINLTYCDLGYLRQTHGDVAPDCYMPDKYWFFRYFGESLYDRHLAAIQAPGIKLHIVDFAQFTSSSSYRQNLLKQLGVRAQMNDVSDPHSNKTENVRILKDLKAHAGWAYTLGKFMLPAGIRANIRRRVSQHADRISDDEKARTEQLFADYPAFSSILNKQG